MNTIQTFILVGRSGSGKGTQIDLLKNYLVKRNASIPVKSLVMGEIYRAFFKGSGYVQDTARDVSMVQGKFQPDFLTNALFINEAVQVIDGASTLFIDGYPRTISQTETLKLLLEYVKRTNPIVINIEVSRNNVKKRMLARGRGDDSETAVESRLNEYDRTVIPMIEAMKTDSFFTYIEINGEPDPETVHKSLIAALGI